MSGDHLVLYDGVCGLCNAVVQFVLPRDHRGTFVYASLQSATGQSWLTRFGRDPDVLDTFAVVTNYRDAAPQLLTKSEGALFVARSLGQPWRAIALLRVLPKTLLDFGYDFVARHRYRMFGRSDVCLIPPAQDRARFIDI